MAFPLFSDPELHQPGVPIEVAWQRYVEMCTLAVQAFGDDLDLSDGQRAFAAAEAFLEALFGEGWFDEHLPEAAAHRADDQEPLAKRRYLLEVTQLGRYLFDLQSFEFFPALVESLKQRPGELRAMMFEAEVVWLLKFFPSLSGIRIPTGVKGDDFDIGVALGPKEWAVEVKAKDDGPFTDNALRKPLEKARSQLPPDGLGIVFVRIPEEWLDDPNYLEAHRRIVDDRLRSGRLQAVILVSDTWLTDANERFQRPAFSIEVVLSKDPDHSVEFLMGQYETLWGLPPGPVHPIWSGVI